MRLVIKRITYENFKGLRHFVLDLQGRNTSIFGENATGKSTLADGFLWCLFGRDSRGQGDFSPKPLTPDGKPIHHLESSVELLMDLDGESLSLKRLYRELWTQPRGSTGKKLTSHETLFEIDGVPITKKADYEARVAAIIDAKLFRLLTDPGAFNDDKVLKWPERRKALLEFCGGVSDAEVIASDRALKALPDILGKRKLEDHKAVVKERCKKINDELERIPVRISEVNRGLPEAGGDSPRTARKVAEDELARLREARQTKAGEQVRIQAGGEVATKQRRITEIEGEILAVQNRLRQTADQAAQQERSKLAAVSDQTDAKRREINRLTGEILEGVREAEALKARLEKLRAEWRQINALGPPAGNQDENCPACGQALLQERLQEARDKALEEYNARKSSLLEQNNAEGKRQKARLDEIMQANTDRREALTHAEAALAALQAQADEIQARLDALRREAPDITQDEEYRKLSAEKARLELDISGLRVDNSAALERVAGELQKLDGEIAAVEGAIGRLDQREAGLLRIKELEAQEKTLSTEFEKLEGELCLCEQFTQAQARLLEERVNGRFKLARFKLFRALINGGLDPCCETLYGGVPFSDLNNGARINVGLDVINTLSEHYGMTAPIWIDNSEAVTRLIPTRAQMIRLVVSGSDNALRIEHEEATKQLTLEVV